MNKEEHNRIVQAGVDKLVKPKDSTDLNRFILQVEDAIKSIKLHAANIKADWQAGGKDTASGDFKKLLLEDVQGKCLDLSINFSKDELAMIMAIQWSVMIVKEIV